VRPAAPGDLPGVLRVLDRAPAVDPDGITSRQRATWDRMLATEDLTQYVATDPVGDVVGVVGLLVMPNLGYDCRPTAFIEAMVVDESHRRRGVGRLLIERLLADATAAGCHKIQLLTHKRHAHDGAHDFYRALGFTAEAEGFRLYLGPR
jgi:GNAT superfamily N-acetyltransferase